MGRNIVLVKVDIRHKLYEKEVLSVAIALMASLDFLPGTFLSHQGDHHGRKGRNYARHLRVAHYLLKWG